jgi:putative spermidine/putrescine transport system substrate-binding protein
MAVLLLSACSSSSSTGSPCKTATSAASCGGMAALISAAKSEGGLTLVGVPGDWANYKAIISGFTSQYGIPVSVPNPNANSRQEIEAVKDAGSSASAPDALDLETSDAVANASLLAPYRVAAWNDIPAGQKDSGGRWFADYGGFMSIAYDSTKVPAITTVQDLLGAPYKGKVALTGNPAFTDAALNAVMMAAMASGGTPDDISRGVAFFHQLKAAGSFVNTPATPATIKSGLTPVVFNWDYLEIRRSNDTPTWHVVIPTYAVVGEYFAQAINKKAHHPAAARLWEEYLYSDDVQNLWLKAMLRPVRMAAMQSAGTLDEGSAILLPIANSTPVYLTPSQSAAAQSYLAANWVAAVS